MIPTRPLRVAVIGAGPIGLEAALRLSTSGFETVIHERGTVAANVQAVVPVLPSTLVGVVGDYLESGWQEGYVAVEGKPF